VPEPASSLRFADAARRLALECRARGLSVPAFRSPPGLSGADRTVRQRADGGVVVAVRVRGRAMTAVVADLVDGVVVANSARVQGAEADALRRELLAALEIVEPPARAA
jgi:hypothetical protein